MNSTPKNRAPRILFGRVFPAIGVVGLAITITLNLAALLVFKKVAAEFFSHGWWSSWFPSYLVWAAFVVMGLAGLVMKKSSDAN